MSDAPPDQDPSERVMGSIDDPKRPVDPLLLQLITDGRKLRAELARSAIVDSASQRLPVLPATQQVLDRLTTFQSAIEAKLDALEQSLRRLTPVPARREPLKLRLQKARRRV